MSSAAIAQRSTWSLTDSVGKADGDNEDTVGGRVTGLVVGAAPAVLMVLDHDEFVSASYTNVASRIGFKIRTKVFCSETL